MQWVFQSDALRVIRHEENHFALSHSIFYTLTDRRTFGKRTEGWKGDNVTRDAPRGGTLPLSESNPLYAGTFGFYYRTTANLTIRPE
ncbi:hypothetical protein OAF34_05725 [Pirellulaceae bacterium]|nr:hypothetical protein [Pirellulaceae bacterium]